MEKKQTEKNAHFATQLLEKIGAPLLSVIENVAPEVSDEEGQIAQAQIMAQLLGQAVAMSTMLYNTLDIKEDEAMADQTRVALTSLVAPFVAEFYLKRKKIPTEENLKRIIKSLEAVLMFGENFKPASDHKSRLQTADQKSVLFDKHQPVLVTLQAMVPVVNAVEEFSFGQSRRKLVQDISSRLEAKAAEIARSQDSPDKLTELIIFKALASVYADCHRSETRRVLENVETARDNLSVDPIWERYETKVQMMEAILGIQASAQSASVGGVAPEQVTPAAVETPAPVQPPAVALPVEQTPVPVAPTAPVTPPPVAQAAAPTAGPMGFFKKEETPAAAPAQSMPPAAAVPETPPATTPPPAASAETASDAPPTGPMGFFKKPKESE